MSPLRLLQVGKYLKPVPGGIETVVYELCRGLAARPDIKVTCLVSNQKSKTVKDRMDQFDVIRAASFGTIASTSISPTFARLGKRIAADLIHFHLPNPLATFFFSNTKVPYVVTYHCDIIRYQKLLALYRPSLIRFLKKSRKIIVVSKDLIHSSSILQEFEDKCKVIPFGIDTKHLELTSDRTAKIKEIKTRFKTGLILFVGRIVKYKGLNILIQAMADTQANLLIVGDGPEKKHLQNLVAEKGLSSKVSFTGYVSQEEMGTYYNACDVFVLPSLDKSEAFGLSLLDALACGKPLITSRLPTGINQINIDGKTGFHVPVGDSKAISEKINQILSQPRLAEEMGRFGKLHFQNSFSLRKMLDSHFELYEDCLCHS